MNSVQKLLREIWKGRTGYLFILVPFVSLCLFFFYPFLRSAFISFTQYDGTTATWVGLQNYRTLIQDEVFGLAARNSLWFTVESLVTGIGLGLLTALIINEVRSGKNFFRGVFFLPVVTNMVAVSMLWRLIYQRNGIINGVLSLFGVKAIAFLGNPDWAMHSIVITSTWQGFGYSMVMFLAAIESIPREYYEAAMVDGANAFRQFWHITLPELRYTLLFLSITGVSGAMMVFTQVYVMTKGGPLDATRTLMFDLFDRFIHLRLGEANAVGMLLFVFLLAFSIINLKVLNRND